MRIKEFKLRHRNGRKDKVSTIELLSCEYITFTTDDLPTPLCEVTGYECESYKTDKKCDYRCSNE